MAYERNGSRYGNANRDRYGNDDNREQYGSSYGRRDVRGDRYGGQDEDRGFFERAGDEVRSWFGDEDAERRRRQDERYDDRSDRGRGDGDRNYGAGRDYDAERSYGAGRGYGAGREQGSFGSSYGAAYGGSGQGGGYGERDRARESSSYSQPAYGRGSSQGGNDRAQTRHDDDHGYRSWRDRQVEALDRDYDEYRKLNQSRFESEFGTWRQGRQTQRDSLKNVKEHQDVLGSDGQHVGTVDHVRGDHIQLTKNDQDAHGKHHRIPSSWVQSVDDKVTLNRTAADAKQQWRDDEGNQPGNRTGALFGRDDREDDRGTNLNRSFSGTY